MGKALFELYRTFGKGEGEELDFRNVEEDTAEARQMMIDQYESGTIYDDKDAFLSGRQDTLEISLEGGDWDDPTGVTIIVSSYDKKKQQIESNYREQLEELNQMFDK